MTSTDLITILPPLVVAAWATVLLLFDMIVSEHRQHVIGWLALIGLAGGALAMLAWPGAGGLVGFGGMVVADGFTVYANLIFLVGGALAVLIGLGFLGRVGLQHSEFYVLLLFSISGMMLLAQTANLIILFLALELLSIPLYVLTGLARHRLDSEEAALKYFLLGVFSTGFLVYGIALTYAATGSTYLTEIAASAQTGTANAGLLLAGAALALVGLGFKVAAAPFHMWIPDVYQGAPSIVTAFMSVGTKAAGFVIILRVFGTAFTEQAAQWGLTFAVLAALTMIFGNLTAVAQTNIKRLLAYSSIAHAGYILMALVGFASTDPALRDFSMGGALFYLLAYAITNFGAWAVVMALEHADSTGLNVDDYAGLAARHPRLALAMAVFMLSLTGIPPTMGFVAKFFLFGAVVQAGFAWLTVIAVLTSAVSAYYYLRVVVVMFMRPGTPTPTLSGATNLAIGLTALATLLFGLLPAPLMDWATRAVLAAAR